MAENSSEKVETKSPKIDWIVFLRTLKSMAIHILLFSLSLFVAFGVQYTENWRSRILTVGEGEQFQTVQQAINAARDGDVIQVSPLCPKESFDLQGKRISISSKGEVTPPKNWFEKVFNFPSGLFLKVLLIILLIKTIVFGLFHQYQISGRYTGILDVYGIFYASFTSAAILILGWYCCMFLFREQMYYWKLANIPVKVMLIDWIATILIVSFYYLYQRLSTYNETGSNLLIVGAGNAGEGLLREIIRMPDSNYRVVGFIDDDRRKKGMRIHGKPVLGTCKEIQEIAKKNKVDEIAIAMPSATPQQLRRVITHCEGTNLRFQMVPDLVSIAAGKVPVSNMRKVNIEDLLGREPVKLDLDLIGKSLQDKIILITGAGGSIGSEMCRQVGGFKPRTLILIEQAENNLFFIERELKEKFPDIDIKSHICDIADARRVEFLFAKYHPEMVIHAAAHKHVPLMELNPGEAIKNNVGGTRNIALASDKFNVDSFVMISTDKAVNPTSIMGSSKRLAEMFIQCLSKRSKTKFVTVRFGNVLGSNGSVIPIFEKQIAAGGPVTVTHPEMRRYFMTIPEASQLVLQAAVMGRGGEVFVLDMGEPVKIDNLAREMIILSGFRPDIDIEIKYSGIRPGEKLFEELAMDAEDMQPTRHPKIAIWKNSPPDENTLNQTIEKLMSITDIEDNHTRIIELIKQVIPEYVGDVDFNELNKNHLNKNKQPVAKGQAT